MMDIEEARLHQSMKTIRKVWPLAVTELEKTALQTMFERLLKKLENYKGSTQ